MITIFFGGEAGNFFLGGGEGKLLPLKYSKKICIRILGPFSFQRETEDNAYAKFWGDKQRALWYVMVFLEWSIVHSPQGFSGIIYNTGWGTLPD